MPNPLKRRHPGAWFVQASLALLWLFAFAEPALADYVEVRLSAIVRERASQQSRELQRPTIGARFELLDDGRRTNGYFHIALADGGRGWIYSPRVVRHPGNLSEHPALDTPTLISDRAGSTMAVHYIDVGQGAAALVELPCAAVLIDAGGESAATTTRLMRYLGAFFARRTDIAGLARIFVTHTHIDHNRALREVAQRYDIGAYVHNGVLRGSGRHNANWMLEHVNPSGAPMTLRAVDDGEVVAAGRQGFSDDSVDGISCADIDPRIRILSARQSANPGWSEDEFVNGNNQSLVIRIDFGAASYLFTGDLEEPAIETMVEYYDGASTLDVDVYHVGHHGSYNGSTISLLQAMSPEIAVISAGRPATRGQWTAYAYGHPRRVAVDMLADAIVRQRAAPRTVRVAASARRFQAYEMRDAIYATPWDGTVIVRADTDGSLRVDTDH